MTPETAVFLTGEEGRALLARAARLPAGVSERIIALRNRGVGLEIASGVVDVLGARQRARGRFPDADRLFFTGDALAQATSPQIAAYHGALLARFGRVADLGCGVGIDALALARVGLEVTAIDRDGARLVFARANAEIAGVADRIRFVQGDLTTLDWEADAVFWDPSRRSDDGRRVSRHGDRYEPPLSFLEALRSRVPAGVLKLSPALPDDELAALGGSVRFLSEGRECREACVAFGDARAPGAPVAALLLPEGTEFSPNEDEGRAPSGPAGAYLFDPDPAIIRAGALGSLCRALNAHLLSGADEYLTGSALPAPDLRRAVSVYRVRQTAPYRPREIGALLRTEGIGRIIVKKRHFPREPDAVARELGLKGGGAEATLVLARESDSGHLAVWCDPVADTAPADAAPAKDQQTNHADL